MLRSKVVDLAATKMAMIFLIAKNCRKMALNSIEDGVIFIPYYGKIGSFINSEAPKLEAILSNSSSSDEVFLEGIEHFNSQLKILASEMSSMRMLDERFGQLNFILSDSVLLIENLDKFDEFLETSESIETFAERIKVSESTVFVLLSQFEAELTSYEEEESMIDLESIEKTILQ